MGVQVEWFVGVEGEVLVLCIGFVGVEVEEGVPKSQTEDVAVGEEYFVEVEVQVLVCSVEVEGAEFVVEVVLFGLARRETEEVEMALLEYGEEGKVVEHEQQGEREGGRAGVEPDEGA